MMLPLPNPAIQTTAFSRDSSTQGYYTANQMTEYGKACAAAAIKELSEDAFSALTIAYLDGLHTGRKQEQDRILRIVHEQANAYGKPGECMEIGIRAKVRAKPEAGIPVSETNSRPQNCGTGHCSCIECPYPKQDWSAA